MATTSHYVKPTGRRVRYTPLTWGVLIVLLVGPLVGPVFSASGWPLLGLINWPLYLMGENVCPQPDLVFTLFGFPLLICSRCWSGVFGLWIVLLTYRAGSGSGVWATWRALPELARVTLALLAFGPWVIDIVAADQGWWASPLPFQLLSGILGGLGAGALLLPLAVAGRGAGGSRAAADQSAASGSAAGPAGRTV
ncbi:MAG TPA: DUF2085 domain-containing protein [Chloroflexia bacterium]|nr:DUF2085 domain-containing protein [Chloroflexia bacterium]